MLILTVMSRGDKGQLCASKRVAIDKTFSAQAVAQLMREFLEEDWGMESETVDAAIKNNKLWDGEGWLSEDKFNHAEGVWAAYGIIHATPAVEAMKFIITSL